MGIATLILSGPAFACGASNNKSTDKDQPSMYDQQASPSDQDVNKNMNQDEDKDMNMDRGSTGSTSESLE